MAGTRSWGTGECPEWQRGRTVNPLAYAFVGSSPTSPTSLRSLRALRLGKPYSEPAAKRAKAAAPKPKRRRRADSRVTARQAGRYLRDLRLYSPKREIFGTLLRRCHGGLTRSSQKA